MEARNWSRYVTNAMVVPLGNPVTPSTLVGNTKHQPQYPPGCRQPQSQVLGSKGVESSTAVSLSKGLGRMPSHRDARQFRYRPLTNSSLPIITGQYSTTTAKAEVVSDFLTAQSRAGCWDPSWLRTPLEPSTAA